MPLNKFVLYVTKILSQLSFTLDPNLGRQGGVYPVQSSSECVSRISASDSPQVSRSFDSWSNTLFFFLTPCIPQRNSSAFAEVTKLRPCQQFLEYHSPQCVVATCAIDLLGALAMKTYFQQLGTIKVSIPRTCMRVHVT